MSNSERTAVDPPGEETNEELDEALRRIFPLEEDDPQPAREQNLLIFDGTANQKLPILMWMGDQVLRRIITNRDKTNDENKKLEYDFVAAHFRVVFRKLQTMAFDITESTSIYPEEERKNFIERCARVVEVFDKDVEGLMDKSSQLTMSLPPQPHQNDIVRFIAEERTAEQTPVPPPHSQQHMFEIPRAAVPMTRIMGIPNSIYVSPKPKGINILPLAYADQNRIRGKIPYAIDLNETYEEVLQGTPKNLTYVGAVYPDGSSLSYLPIKDITLVRVESTAKLPTLIDGGVVDLNFPRIIYENIKHVCASAYLQRYTDHTIRYPFEQVIDGQNIKIQALARGYRRMRIINGKRVFHVSLFEVLQQCSHDMTGDGLLHLRFDRQSREDKRATMKIIFFGLQMERNTSNHFQKIFRL